MDHSASRGTFLLTAAQLWHAVSGYLVFIVGARILGREDYDGLVLVIWTMTTLEVFVVDGVPKAVSWWTARLPEGAAGIARRGLVLTLGLACAVGGALALAAPLVVATWGEPDLATSVRLSALDLVAFVAFAVLTQSVNGLRRYGAQASIWFLYSTAKVLGILGLLRMGWGVEGAVLGYVIASVLGSLAAAVISAPHLVGRRGRDLPDRSRLLRFGLPNGTLGLCLMALVNVDLWAAKRASGDDGTAGDYAGASMLARALFFVFKAFGDALFPAVAGALARGQASQARSISRRGLAQLCCLMLPVCGCATGAAQAVLETLFGSAEWGAGAVYIRWLAPSSVLWVFTAVFAALVAAAARPGRAAGLLTVVLVMETVLVFQWAAASGPQGAAMGSLTAAAAGCLLMGTVSWRLLGAVVPWSAMACAACAGLILDRALTLWTPPGWWVFLYGAGLFGLSVLALVRAGLMPLKASA